MRVYRFANNWSIAFGGRMRYEFRVWRSMLRPALARHRVDFVDWGNQWIPCRNSPWWARLLKKALPWH